MAGNAKQFEVGTVMASTRDAAMPLGVDVDRPTSTLGMHDDASPPPTPLRSEDPKLLGDRYVVLSLLGRGAMGVVYRAYDKSVGREVAVKVLQTPNHEAQARLVAEARAMAKLSDPHVVAVYDVLSALGSEPLSGGMHGHDASSGRVLLVMQYVQGTTLQQWLQLEHSTAEVIDAFVQAGRGLWAAHRAGIVHRDFKPANVLVSDDGRVLVTDFGIAGSCAEPGTSDTVEHVGSTLYSRVQGTPWYMPPEQHLGQPVDPRADQYAFCVSLWEALTRASLFGDAADSAALIARKHAALPAWPRPDDVTRPVVSAIYRGLAMRPDDRFATMEELLAALAVQREQGMRRLGTISLVSLSIAGGALGWSWYSESAQHCAGAREQLRGVYDGDKADAIRASLLATGLPYASDAATRLAQKLGNYTDAWASEHRSACEATTVHHEQPLAVMDLRMACLQRAKVELLAVTDVLTQADAQVLERAQRLVDNLPELERCADIEALQAEVPPPEPAHVDVVESARAKLAEVSALRDAGKYAEMLAQVEPLADSVRDVPYAPLRVDVMIELGIARESTGSYDGAETALEEALRWSLSSGQWERAVLAATLLVRIVGAEQMRPTEALAYAETARALLGVADGSAEMALRAHVGTALAILGRYAEAEAEHRAAVALAEAAHGAEHLDVATYRSELSNTLVSRGRFAEAEREQRAALAVKEAVLGPDHPDVARARSALAQTLFDRGRYAESEAEHRAALAVWENALGTDHLDVANEREAFAVLLMEQGREAEAEPEFRAVLRVLTNALGPTHVRLGVTHANLGISLLELDRYLEAEEHLRQALAIYEKTHGSRHPATAGGHSGVAVALVEQRRYVEAEAHARRAVAIFDAYPGHEPPIVASAHNNLAAALKGQGRFAEAEAEFRVTLELLEKSLGSKHPHLARIRAYLGNVLEARGQLDEAEAQHRAALTMQIELLGAEHPRVLDTRGRLANVLRAQRRFGEAEREYRAALALCEASAGRDHPDAAPLLGGLARTLLERGHPRTALPLFERAWNSWRDDDRVAAMTRGMFAFGLARALSRSAGDLARARTLALRARELFELSPGMTARERAEVDAWLRRL